MRLKKGIITQGSLSKGITMRLDPQESVEHIKAGKFMVIEGESYDFFAMITDVTLEASNKDILLYPPATDEPLLREVLQGYATFATIQLKPMLMLPAARHTLQEFLEEKDREKVKTVPTHFSLVADANEEDIARIFGSETQDEHRFFNIGKPLEMEAPVALDMLKFVERSNAVFGKTGTGKTFLTRLLLAGCIKTGTAVNLIFDMHSEYGTAARQEGSDTKVKGLQDIFGSGKIKIFSLDPDATRQRKARADVEVYLYADQIEPEDILLLEETLGLNRTASESTFLLERRFGTKWLIELMKIQGDEELKDLAESIGANFMSLSALKRKLERLSGLSFFTTESRGSRRDAIREMLHCFDAGESVILEFGRYNNLLAYLLVANVLTRSIRNAYEERANRYLASDDPTDKPNQLLITIEEAHKFLSPGIARETSFGKIAREMRKFFVSLLIVDQRPSAIDEEVLSQIGTKIVAQLNDDKDIGAALVGTSDAGGLRQVLATLSSKQQALILGHGVPMPVVVHTRSYDPTFYEDMRKGKLSGEDAVNLLFNSGNL